MGMWVGDITVDRAIVVSGGKRHYNAVVITVIMGVSRTSGHKILYW